MQAPHQMRPPAYYQMQGAPGQPQPRARWPSAGTQMARVPGVSQYGQVRAGRPQVPNAPRPQIVPGTRPITGPQTGIPPQARQPTQAPRPPPQAGRQTNFGGVRPPIRPSGTAPANQAISGIPGQADLTPSMLADATPQDQKQMLGERLYPLIASMHPEEAGKITGMLLEIDNSELLHMLEHQESLKAKVDEAVAVLQAHQAKAGVKKE